MFGRKDDLKPLLEQKSKELHDCRATIRDIITKSMHGVLIMDENRTVLSANPAAEAIFGFTAKELLGKSLDLPITTGETRELKTLTRDGKPVTIELWTINTEWNGAPAFYISIQDVTRRKEQEQELRKLYRAITHSPISVVITDNQARIEYVNPKFTEVTGFTFAEVIGKTPGILKSGKVPPEEYEKLWETISRGEEWRGEFLNKKKSGELFYESAYISAVKDFDGNITNFIAVKEDITKQKQMEAELERLSIPQLNPNPLLELDSAGTVTFSNRAAEEILKLTLKSTSNPFLPADLPDILLALRENKSQSYVREIVISDMIYEEHLYLVPQFNVIRIYAKEITALKRAEEEVKRLTARLRELEAPQAAHHTPNE